MFRKKIRTLLLLVLVCVLSLLLSACEKAADIPTDVPTDTPVDTPTDAPTDTPAGTPTDKSAENSAGPSQEQVWDNPSYYSREISHPLAETEAGYYVFLNNLLYYVDKSSLEVVLLSGQPYTPDELLANRDKLRKSDAYFGDAASVFYRGDSLLVLGPGDTGDTKLETYQLYELGLEGGERKELTSLNISPKFCLLEDTLYAIKDTITEKADRLSTLVSYDLASKDYKEYPPFPEELRGGINIQVQRLVPYRGKVYLEAVVDGEDRADSVVYSFDPQSETTSLLIGRFPDQEGRVLQSLTFYEDKVLLNTSKEEAQSLKANNQVLQWQDGEISPFELVDWPLVLLSNGQDLWQLPSEITWIAHILPLDEDYAENAKEPLTLGKFEDDQSLTLDPQLLTPEVFPLVMVNAAGEPLIYNNPGNAGDLAYLLILQEGEFKRVP